jgi:hypothetical protein
MASTRHVYAVNCDSAYALQTPSKWRGDPCESVCWSQAACAWAMATPGARLLTPQAPEKGVFPLDHFGECKQARGGAQCRYVMPPALGAWCRADSCHAHTLGVAGDVSLHGVSAPVLVRQRPLQAPVPRLLGVPHEEVRACVYA